ncbi:hypothetical protein ACF06Q_21695 [Streptomyces leeuwenhoekii]|uniref:hypothetical protein n=1 Tax=Streptomyces leeuwenhoekii TaxID=1437453 RepID=UPI0036F5C91A
MSRTPLSEPGKAGALRDYTEEKLAAQPIGAWSGEIYRRAVGALRAQLAVEDLTQPHWWILNDIAGAPGTWTRAALTARLTPYEDLGIDFDTVYDDLVARGWLTEAPRYAPLPGAMTLTEPG